MEEEIRDDVPQEGRCPETECAVMSSEDAPESEVPQEDAGGVPKETVSEEEPAPAPLHNPLPEPVPGRRDEMEFPITDIDDEEDPLADPADARTAGKPEGSGGSCPESDPAPGAGTAVSSKAADEEPEDDFDFQIDDSDDFDI